MKHCNSAFHKVKLQYIKCRKLYTSWWLERIIRRHDNGRVVRGFCCIFFRKKGEYWQNQVYVFLFVGHFSYIHTVRRPVKLGQVIEVKTQLTHRDYINLLSQRDSSHFTVFKKRRCFLVNNQYFQLDIYESPSHPRYVCSCTDCFIPPPTLLECFHYLDTGLNEIWCA